MIRRKLLVIHNVKSAGKQTSYQMMQEDSYLKQQQYRQDLQQQIHENQTRKLHQHQQRKLIQQMKNQRIQEQIQLEEQVRLQLRRRLPILPQMQSPQLDREKLKQDLRLKFQQDNPFYLGLKNKPTVKLVHRRQPDPALRETQQNFLPRAGKVQVFKRENDWHRQIKQQSKRQYNLQLFKQIQENKVRRYSQILKKRSEEQAFQIKERAEREAQMIRLRQRQRIQMAKLQQQRLFRQRFQKKIQQLQIQNSTLKKSKRIRTEESLNRSIESLQTRQSRVHTRAEERERSVQFQHQQKKQEKKRINSRNIQRPRSKRVAQKQVNTTSQLSQQFLNKQLTNLRMEIKRQNQIIYTQLKKVQTESKAKGRVEASNEPPKKKQANPQQFRSLKDLVGKGEGWKKQVDSLLQLLERG